MTSIILASQLSVIREGMKRILLAHDDMHVIAELADSGEIKHDILALADVVIVAQMPSAGRDDFLPILRRDFPLSRVIVVARTPNLQQVVATLKTGVRGLLDTSCSAAQLVAAIRAVSAGKIYLHDVVSDLMTADLEVMSKDHSHNALTQRETEIFMRLAIGKKVSEIALELGISIKTVSTHKAHIMERMGMASSSQLVQYAIANGLFHSADNHSG